MENWRKTVAIGACFDESRGVAKVISNAASRGFGTERGAWDKECCAKYPSCSASGVMENWRKTVAIGACSDESRRLAKAISNAASRVDYRMAAIKLSRGIGEKDN